MSVEAAGIFALGFFVAYLTWFFVKRLDSFTTEALTAIIGVVVGGLVVKFLDSNAAQGANVWWYPIGLVAGFAVYVIFNWFATGEPPTVAGITATQEQIQSQTQTHNSRGG